MSRDKQIYIDEAVEGMASAIREITTKCGKCEYYKDGSCLKPIDIGCNENEDILNCCDAIYEKGYRKTSEVARKIFEEADKIFMANCLSLETYGAWLELKKKYTEGGE